MKAYWVGHVTVGDPQAYEAYRQANGPAFARFGGRFLVRGGARRLVEGELRERTVVIEFPSFEAAQACFDSAEYQAARALRLGCSLADLCIIEGYDGPQPG